MSMNYKNFGEVLMERSGQEDKGITFIEGRERECFVSYGKMSRTAAAILSYLQEKGLKPGDQLVLQLNNNQDFVAIFWACLLGKFIPVPITFAVNAEYILKLFNIWRLLKTPYLITFKKHMETLRDFGANNRLTEVLQHIELHTVMLEDLKTQMGKGEMEITDESDTAFIQYSSGSTGSPKGVVLTHKNLLTNIKAIIKAMKARNEERYLSWMPLTHDMGLIGLHLVPLTCGWNHCLMETQLFVRYPMLWLQKASQYKSTILSSPNFGYKYVLKHFKPEKCKGLDISSVRIIFNGAEPISAELCSEFLDRLAPFGLKKNAMYPVYGLAEASVAVTFPEPDTEMRVGYFDRRTLNIGEIAKEKEKTDVDSIPLVEVGSPIENCFVRIVDDQGNEVGNRVMGHIEIKGDNVTSGYYNNPEATKEILPSTGWLKTGDLGFLREGRLVVTGRVKDVIFFKGQNIYPHDLEREAEEVKGIEFEKVAFCGVFNPDLQSEEIICFVVFKRSIKELLPLAKAIKNHIMEKMSLEVSKIIPVKKIPKTTSGKLQRFKLQKQYQEGYYDTVLQEIAQWQSQEVTAQKNLSKLEIKDIVLKAWCEVLNLEKQSIGENEHFFELGGNSSKAVQVKAKLQEKLGNTIDDAAMFIYPTINTLVNYLSGNDGGEKLSAQQKERLAVFSATRRRIREEAGNTGNRNGSEIAVMGMAGRFPGANTIDEFWNNLINGVEAISFFSDQELMGCGIDSPSLQSPDYVKAKGVLDGLDYFDAAFFKYSTVEAGKMDPQMRVLHECSWEALEDAGYYPEIYQGLIGVYVGASPNLYWESASLSSVPGKSSTSQQFIDTQLIDKDFMTTRLSYKLNLKGPSFSMYTACSTSLVAVDLACQGLLNGRCDLALAGGISIWMPQKTGYLYEEGMLFSGDGHNRTFDRQANGTIFSDGAGIVALKRLGDALTNRDHIYAVIKGSATNNDGDRKVGYTAPALEGQAEVIVSALQAAGVEPENIGYIEAHGTATFLGDSIEIDALNLAFQTLQAPLTPGTPHKKYCALGSVKSNLGHLNAAAGTAGLIKTILALNYRLIPPSLHFHIPNSTVNFDNSPFYVNTKLQEWTSNGYPLRAGVSSFGIGGTNAHVVIEEPPQIETSAQGREWKLVILSANTKASLDKAGENLVKFLKKNPNVNLADAAYTLQVGRKPFRYRKMTVCSNLDEAKEALSSPASGKLFTMDSKEKKRPVIFMFPGQASQYINMGLELYRSEQVFRQEMDRCFEIFKSITGYDIKEILYSTHPTPSGHPSQEGSQGDHSGSPLQPDRIHQTEISQPVIFMFEYALAQLLISWGIHPQAMIGYSFGEYAAACISGVLSLEDAIKLIVVRGRLMQQMPKGAMLSVPLPMDQLKPFLDNQSSLSIAVDNGPSCIVSGTTAAIEVFEKQMKEKKFLCTRVNISHASHSPVMAPIMDKFEKEVRKITLNNPQIPYMSNVTGKLVSGSDVTDPSYWVNHLKNTVRFGDGIGALLTNTDAVFVEVGPGRDLCVLLTSHKNYRQAHRAINLVRHQKEKDSDLHYLLNRVGHLWLYGVDIHWQGFYANEKRHRIPLPTYSFEGQYFPINRTPFHPQVGKPGGIPLQKKADIRDWFYTPVWKRSRIPSTAEIFVQQGPNPMRMVLFMDESGWGNKIVKRLKPEGYTITIVRMGKAFSRVKEDEYIINPTITNDYETLFSRLSVSPGFPLPSTIIHLWCVTPTVHRDEKAGFERVEQEQDKGFHSLIALAQALGKQDPANHFQIKVVSNNVQDVIGGDALCPEKATLLGPVKAIGQEYGNICCCNIDVVLPEPHSPQELHLVDQLVQEFKIKIMDTEKVIAYRNGFRCIQTFQPVRIEKPTRPITALREKGVYLITGGLGGVGLLLAQHLAKSVKAKLILTRRSAFPASEDWDKWLADHETNEKTSQAIRKIREIQRLGVEVHIISADASDSTQMQREISGAEHRFGQINGVIHAAGVPDGALVIRRTREMSASILAPKVTGTLVLEKVLKNTKLDFFILCSSITSILSLPGQAAYTAANAFLDVFAASRIQKNAINPISINWDRWQNVGMSITTEKEYTGLLGEERETGITAAEGVEVFNRILAESSSPLPQVVVSPIDLKLKIERLEASGILSENDIWKEGTAPKNLQERPELSVAYVEPQSEVEQKLAEIWQQFLGINHVGIHDNFFELGATSLGIIQVNNQLKKLFSREIPVVTIYSYPTIALLAKFLLKGKPGDDFFSHEERSFEKMDKGQKKLKYLKSKRRSGE